VAAFKQMGRNAKENAKSLLFNARGDLRRDRIGVLVGAVAGFLAFVLIVRGIARRGRKS
jgi:hypothetical protein